MSRIAISINGYDTYYLDNSSSEPAHFLIKIPAHATPDMAIVCGKIIANKLIIRTDYQTIEGERYLVAYF